LALFDMFLIYDWPYLHVCILHEKLLFFTLILGSVFSDCVELMPFLFCDFCQSFTVNSTVECRLPRSSLRSIRLIVSRSERPFPARLWLTAGNPT